MTIQTKANFIAEPKVSISDKLYYQVIRNSKTGRVTCTLLIAEMDPSPSVEYLLKLLNNPELIERL